MSTGRVLALVLLVACGGARPPAASDAAPAGPVADAGPAADDAGLDDADAAPAAAADLPAADPGPPTRADCEAAVARMTLVAPGLVPGDAQDVEDCLHLPGPFVRCLSAAADRAAVDACTAQAPPPRPR
jgi:hypothetical protein